MVVFARRNSGRLAHISEIENGKACHCTCLACDEALVARQGRIREHSFAHQSGTQCHWFCLNNRERLRGSLTWQASKGQGIELVSGGRGFVFVAIELPLFDHVHGLDACDDGASAAQ